MGVTTHRTSRSAPLFKTGAVKHMLAENGQKTGGLIHALKAYRARRQFDKGWRRWCMGLGRKRVGSFGERILGIMRECSGVRCI